MTYSRWIKNWHSDQYAQKVSEERKAQEEQQKAAEQKQDEEEQKDE